MAKVLVHVFQSASTLSRSVTISQGSDPFPVFDLWQPPETYEQHAMCFSDFVVFDLLADIGTYFLEIWVADTFVLDSNSQRAVVVPFRVADTASICISDDDTYPPIPIKSGQYQLLLECRRFTDAELALVSWFSAESLQFLQESQSVPYDPTYWSWYKDLSRPNLVRLTFIPTTETAEAKLIREDYQDQDSPLIRLDH